VTKLRADSIRGLFSTIQVGFEVLTAVSTKMAVFWVVAPCSLVEVYQRFRGPCCLHYQALIALIMETATPSETSVNFYQTTRCYSPEDIHLLLPFSSEPSIFLFRLSYQPFSQSKFYTCFHSDLNYRMFHLKHNPDYNSICKLWWHQYNKTNELLLVFIC
jgi:hypothetical protein